MTSQTLVAARWATASHADVASTQPSELDALGAHMGDCRGAVGKWFSVECLIETVHAFMAPRMVTTVSLAVLVLATTALLS